MKPRLSLAALALAIGLSSPLFATAAQDPLADLPWQAGPASGAVGQRSTLVIPAGAALLPEAHGSRFLELTGNLPMSGRTILAGEDWFAVLKFVDEGYVKDDEKIDAAALLQTLKDSDGPANSERRRRGIPELTTVGWHVPPHYDPATRHLEWGLKLRASNSPDPIINYTVKILGRHGHESATLVSSPATLDEDMKAFKAALKGFQFNNGERYAEFRSGDKVAAYGLGALVLGGAATMATKKGFWASLVALLLAGKKLAVGLVLALLVGIGKLFGLGKGRE